MMVNVKTGRTSASVHYLGCRSDLTGWPATGGCPFWAKLKDKNNPLTWTAIRSILIRHSIGEHVPYEGCSWMVDPDEESSVTVIHFADAHFHIGRIKEMMFSPDLQAPLNRSGQRAISNVQILESDSAALKISCPEALLTCKRPDRDDPNQIPKNLSLEAVIPSISIRRRLFLEVRSSDIYLPSSYECGPECSLSCSSPALSVLPRRRVACFSTRHEARGGTQR